jgi:hypothetical protein
MRLLIAVPGDGSLLAVASTTGGSLTTKDSGSVAIVTFGVVDGFSGTTTVTLDSLSTTASRDWIRFDTSPAESSVRILVKESRRPADFNDDGAVDFSDFLIFAAGFGKSCGELGFDTRLDLNNSCSVGFGDFLDFAIAYGT